MYTLVTHNLSMNMVLKLEGGYSFTVQMLLAKSNCTVFVSRIPATQYRRPHVSCKPPVRGYYNSEDWPTGNPVNQVC